MSTHSSIPTHIGYIVDGNRRWAKQHGLPAYEGHLAGYNAIKDIAVATFDAGVEYMSAYVFSTENWKRSEAEVGKLMGLVLRLLTADLPMFDERNIRLRILGTRERLSDKIIQAIEEAEARTAHNTAGTLALCFNYGGQQELADAYARMLEAAVTPQQVTPDVISSYLYASEVPPIDMVVRTSGEQRLSNFMLWRAAYSEFLFLEKQWPDMTSDDVTAILEEYMRRSRRFGG